MLVIRWAASSLQNTPNSCSQWQYQFEMKVPLGNVTNVGKYYRLPTALCHGHHSSTQCQKKYGSGKWLDEVHHPECRWKNGDESIIQSDSLHNQRLVGKSVHKGWRGSEHFLERFKKVKWDSFMIVHVVPFQVSWVSRINNKCKCWYIKS